MWFINYIRTCAYELDLQFGKKYYQMQLHIWNIYNNVIILPVSCNKFYYYDKHGADKDRLEQ